VGGYITMIDSPLEQWPCLEPGDADVSDQIFDFGL